jgi:hypothetical protein
MKSQTRSATPAKSGSTAMLFRRVVTFRRLEAASFTHSAVYLALLVCAFAAGSPQPETFVLGLTHGLMWIGMSIVCLGAARVRIIPFWLAVTVAVLGGLGPFAGSIGFIVAQRREGHPRDPSGPVVTRYS